MSRNIKLKSAFSHKITFNYESPFSHFKVLIAHRILTTALVHFNTLSLRNFREENKISLGNIEKLPATNKIIKKFPPLYCKTSFSVPFQEQVLHTDASRTVTHNHNYSKLLSVHSVKLYHFEAH